MCKPQPFDVFRYAYGWSREDLAEEVGCSAEWLGALARGEGRPSRMMVRALARVLDLPESEVFRQ